MTPANVASYVRYRTKTNSTTFTDANMLMLANIHIDELSKAIVNKVDEDYFLQPATTNLVANQREYAFDTSSLQITYVEAKLDGTNWIKLVEMGTHDYGGATDETSITNNFSNDEGEAKYITFRKSIYLFSGTISSVTSGLKVWHKTWPAHIATDMTGATDLSIDPTTTTHGFPRQLHKVLCDLIVIDWKNSADKPIALTEREASVEYYIQKGINALRNSNKDREIIGTLPSASARWNEGYDL